MKLRIAYGIVAVGGLLVVYLSQRFNYLELANSIFGFSIEATPNSVFIANRIARFVLNDLLAILLIYSIFQKRKYALIAFMVQGFGLLVVLPLYLYLKLSIEGPSEISSPLLSHLHRIIIHPVMILLLIPAFYFNNRQSTSQ